MRWVLNRTSKLRANLFREFCCWPFQKRSQYFNIALQSSHYEWCVLSTRLGVWVRASIQQDSGYLRHLSAESLQMKIELMVRMSSLKMPGQGFPHLINLSSLYPYSFYTDDFYTRTIMHNRASSKLKCYPFTYTSSNYVRMSVNQYV